MSKPTKILTLAIAMALLGLSLATAATITQKGNLRVKVDGKLSPKKLPRKGAAPISVTVGGEISTTDETLPPQLSGLRIELNRKGILDATGLPVCPYPKIQPGSTSRALAGCKGSLVGKGSFSADITLAGQEPYPTQGRLVVFNGEKADKPVLYGHIYSAKPFATSFVIVFELSKHRKGTYGTVLSATLPKAMKAWGRLTGLEMTLSRTYSVKGKKRSFISAGCPVPKGFSKTSFSLARSSFEFVGGMRISSVLGSECSVRG